MLQRVFISPLRIFGSQFVDLFSNFIFVRQLSLSPWSREPKPPASTLRRPLPVPTASRCRVSSSNSSSSSSSWATAAASTAEKKRIKSYPASSLRWKHSSTRKSVNSKLVYQHVLNFFNGFTHFFLSKLRSWDILLVRRKRILAKKTF